MGGSRWLHGRDAAALTSRLDGGVAVTQGKARVCRMHAPKRPGVTARHVNR